MSAQALTAEKASASHLRPFDIRRDLSAVADLVELCFKNSLDADGRLYIRQMRRTAKSGHLLNLAAAAGGGSNTPPGGFVWVEAVNLVGNLSLIPVFSQGVTRYLIANVSVHPDFRRKGIARSLTQAALERVENTFAKEVWLQVDSENPAAQNLYRSMGFIERAQRSTWQSASHLENSPPELKNLTIRSVANSDWPQHLKWLNEIYPLLIRWNLPLDIKQLQPGWRGSFQRFLGDRQSQQWAAQSNGELLALLNWQSTSLQADRLWVATSQKNETLALPALLAHAQLNLRRNRSLLLDYPADRGVSVLQEAGYTLVRSLIWMQHDSS